eukprot:391481_1
MPFLSIYVFSVLWFMVNKAANPDGSCTNPKFRWFETLDTFYNFAENSTIPAIQVNISLDTESRCLDGSHHMFYFRKGFGDGINKYQIYLMGGGLCASYDECYDRATNPNHTYKGSSTVYTKYGWYSSDYLSDNKTENSLMYNWNTIWLLYCDGSAWTGNNLTIYPYKVNNTYTQNLYFRGHINLRNAMTVIYNEYGLNNATDVVISGCSAGGWGTYINTNYIFKNFINNIAASKFMVIPQSGFFPQTNPITNGQNFVDRVMWVYNTQNVTYILNEDCLEYYKTINGSLSNCMYPQYIVRFLTYNKIFAINSIYDTYTMGIQGINKNNYSECSEFGIWVSHLFMNNFLNTNVNLHGGLLYSCYSHCGEYNNINVSNILTGNSIEMFYYGNLTSIYEDTYLIFQNETYPCEECCFANYVVASNVSVCTHNNEECDPNCE